MILKEHELLQIDENFICQLLAQNPQALAGLSIKLVNDLKEALERLNQNPTNSSRPSGSLAVWEKGSQSDEDKQSAESFSEQIENGHTKNVGDDPSSDQHLESDVDVENSPNQKPKAPKKPGRQPGSPGFGRTQKLEATAIIEHICGYCIICQEDLSNHGAVYTAFQTIDVELAVAPSAGLHLTNTEHRYYQCICPHCGLENRTEPFRAPADPGDWKNVGLTQWRLVGPTLAALIVYLAMDMRLTRRKLKRLLSELLGVELSVGTLQQTLLESARALEPAEAQLVEDLCRESTIYADETSHPEGGDRLWLWVFTPD